MERIAICGLGPVGAFGAGRGELEAALAGRVPRTQLLTLRAEGGERQLPVLQADLAPLERFVPRRSLRRVDRFSRLALLAGHLALEDAAWLDAPRQRLGVVVASGYGATATTFGFLDSVQTGGDSLASPTLFSTSVHNAAAANLAIHLGARGPSLTVSQFELSVPVALLTAQTWLCEDRADAILFGAVDELCDVLGYCWTRYGEPEAPRRLTAAAGCPGEGGAFFLLTREERSRPRYGYLEAVTLGPATRLPSPPKGSATVLVGATGRAPCAAQYRPWLEASPEPLCHQRLWGSLPAGAALDLAAGCLYNRNRADGPVHCLRADTDGGFGLLTLGR